MRAESAGPDKRPSPRAWPQRLLTAARAPMAYHAPPMSAPIYLLNGPNLDLLGEREPEIYGRDTLADIEQRCRMIAQRHGLELIAHQSNAEHEIIHWLHQARSAAGIVHNPGGFSYYSVAI